jgi:hypothetical protein
MNYAMHPINFYLSGVISADFPGEASRYVEELFDNRTVAIFSQGASGDQNPRDFRFVAVDCFFRQRGPPQDDHAAGAKCIACHNASPGSSKGRPV